MGINRNCSQGGGGVGGAPLVVIQFNFELLFTSRPADSVGGHTPPTLVLILNPDDVVDSKRSEMESVL